MLSLSQIVGVIVDETPLAVGCLGVEYYAAASVGRGFLVYRADMLAPFVYSPALPDTIRQMAVYSDKTVVMYQRKTELEIYTRGRLVAEISGLLHRPLCLVLQESTLVAFDTSGRYIIYDLEFMEQIKPPRSLPLEHPTDTCSLVMHPDTYLNKVLVVTSSGRMELHNIDKNKRVTALRQGPNDISLAHGEPVVGIVNSPEIDVVAVIQPSRVSMVHLKKQRVLFALPCDLSGDSFTCATFSSVHAIVFVGTEQGRIQAFDLDARRILCELKAHSMCVTSLFWLPDTYILSSGADNTIRILGYDSNLTVIQQIKHRTGHRGGVSLAKFYRESSSNIVHAAETCPFLLTAGLDKTLRYVQIYQRNNSELFSSHDKQYPSEVIDFDACELRDEHWANVVTAHRGEDFCHLWAFYKNKELIEPLPDRYLGREALEKREMAKLKKENGGVLPQDFVDARAAERFRSRYRITLPTSVKFIENEDNLTLVAGNGDDANENYLACRLSSESVSCCVISLCGNYVALAGTRSSAAVYALQSGRLVGCAPCLFSHPDCLNRSVVRLSFSYDGLMLYAVNSIGYIVLFDIRARKAVKEVSLRSLLPDAEGGDIVVTAVAFDVIRGLVSITSATVLYVLDISQSSGIALSRMQSINIEVPRNCLSFFEHGQRLVYGGSVDDSSPEMAGSHAAVIVYDILLDKIVAKQQFREFSAISSITVTSDNTVVAITFVGVPGVYIYKNNEKYGLGIALDDAEYVETSLQAESAEKNIRHCLDLLTEGPQSLGIILHKDSLLASRLYAVAMDRHATRELLEQYGGRLRRAGSASTKDRLPFYIGLQAKDHAQLSRAGSSCFQRIFQMPSDASSLLLEITTLNHGIIDQEIQCLNGDSLSAFCSLLGSWAGHHSATRTYASLDVFVVIFCCLLRYHALTISKSKELLSSLRPVYAIIEEQYNHITNSVNVITKLIDTLVY